MATFTTNPNHPANFYAFDINALHGIHLYSSSPTLLRVGNAMFDTGDNIEFAGVGFSYSGGALTGGTINSITSHIGGAVDFQISGMSMSVASFNAYAAAGNTEGFLTAVFAGADSITGSNLNDNLKGYAGNDTMNGLDGDDVLDGGAGADAMTGGKGNDTYYIDNAWDVIVETGASTADWVVSSLNIDLTKAAFIGIEHASLLGSANLNVTGDSGANWIMGNNGNNKLAGNQGNDIMMGGAGHDTLDGGSGDDKLYGGSGNDIYYVDSNNDKVDESATDGGDAGGVDLVYSTAESYSLANWVENATLVGTGENVFGNSMNNILVGNAGNNALIGNGGADTMTGGAGNDYYQVDHLQDKVVEYAGGGNDTVFSSISYTLGSNVEFLDLTGAALSGKGNTLNNVISGNDVGNTLDGAEGNDHLYGEAGNDTLIGGAGNDNLHGGAGTDTLDVSQGNDTVWYESTLDGADIIQGFDGDAAGGQDQLHLGNYFDALGVDDQDRAGRVQVVDKGTSVDIWVDTNGDGLVNAMIVTIQTADTITVGGDINLS